MRAPAPKRSVEEAALEEARRRLCHLLVAGSVVPWGERGADADDPKKKLAAAIVTVECALGEAERVLTEVLECPINKTVKGDIADAIPLIKLAREAAIPELRRARPSIGQHGRTRDLNAYRDQTIAEAAKAIREQFKLSKERTTSIISEALEELVEERKLALRRLITEKGANPEWIKECLAPIIKLALSVDRVRGITKTKRG